MSSSLPINLYLSGKSISFKFEEKFILSEILIGIISIGPLSFKISSIGKIIF
jgi:hypothetical protein